MSDLDIYALVAQAAAQSPSLVPAPETLTQPTPLPPIQLPIQPPQ
jgi:hypothetical protein